MLNENELTSSDLEYLKQAEETSQVLGELFLRRVNILLSYFYIEESGVPHIIYTAEEDANELFPFFSIARIERFMPIFIQVLNDYSISQELMEGRSKFIKLISKFLSDYNVIFSKLPHFLSNKISPKDRWIQNFINRNLDDVEDYDVDKALDYIKEWAETNAKGVNGESIFIPVPAISSIFEETPLKLNNSIKILISISTELEKRAVYNIIRTRSLIYCLGSDDIGLINIADWYSWFDSVENYLEYKSSLTRLKNNLLEEYHRAVLEESKSEYKRLSTDVEELLENIFWYYGTSLSLNEKVLREVLSSLELNSKKLKSEDDFDNFDDYIEDNKSFSEFKSLWGEALECFLLIDDAKKVYYDLDHQGGLISKADYQNSEVVEVSDADIEEEGGMLGKAMTKLLNSQAGNIGGKLKAMGFQLTAEALNNDSNIERVADFVYNLLPMPVRFVVKYEKVRDFLLTHRQWLINKLV